MMGIWFQILPSIEASINSRLSFALHVLPPCTLTSHWRSILSQNPCALILLRRKMTWNFWMLSLLCSKTPTCGLFIVLFSDLCFSKEPFVSWFMFWLRTINFFLIYGLVRNHFLTRLLSFVFVSFLDLEFFFFLLKIY